MKERSSIPGRFELFEAAIISTFWILLFASPVLLMRDGTSIDWEQVFKIWKEHTVLLALFLINRFILLPYLFFRERRAAYLASVFSVIFITVLTFYYSDRKPVRPADSRPPAEAPRFERPGGTKPPPEGRPGPGRPVQPARKQSEPLPPYVNLLILSVLVFGFDSGLRITSKWIRSEQDRMQLEKDNIESQLSALKHQISPHFFMNTLNNIYGLIDADSDKSKEAVMKLAKLMRYLLYGSQNGKGMLSKEFEFIKNYIDLMKLRFVEDVEIKLTLPDIYDDVEVPVLIFVSYIENAFKFGTSYERRSYINISFSVENEKLIFECKNSKSQNVFEGPGGGIGLKNSRERLGLIYGSDYNIEVKDLDDSFTVRLIIPLK